MLGELASTPGRNPDYSLQQGVIRYKKKIYVGREANLKSKILKTMHQSPLGGHSGQHGTYKRVQLVFYWPNMKLNIFKLVSDCDVCHRIKSENMHTLGLLQPVPIPDQV